MLLKLTFYTLHTIMPRITSYVKYMNISKWSKSYLQAYGMVLFIAFIMRKRAYVASYVIVKWSTILLINMMFYYRVHVVQKGKREKLMDLKK